MSIKNILALFALFLAVANAQVRGNSRRLRLDNNAATLADAVVDKVKQRFLMKEEEKEDVPVLDGSLSLSASLSSSLSYSMSSSLSYSMSI